MIITIRLQTLYAFSKIHDNTESIQNIHFTKRLLETTIQYQILIQRNTKLLLNDTKTTRRRLCRHNGLVKNLVTLGASTSFMLFLFCTLPTILTVPNASHNVPAGSGLTRDPWTCLLFRGGRCCAALEIFDELQVVGLKPDFYTYCNMLDGLCKNGQTERASSLLDALEHKGEHLHIAYDTIVMDGFCESKNLDAARTIFWNLQSKGLEPNVVTYTIMIKGCCQNGLLEEVKHLLSKMEEASLVRSEVNYNVLVQGILVRGEHDAAAKYLAEMDDKGFSPDSFTFALLLDLFDTKEKNPALLKMIEKLALNTSKQRL